MKLHNIPVPRHPCTRIVIPLCLYLVFCSLVSAVRTGGKGEIANGVVVDYNTAKASYPFMARLVMDGAIRCGGAVISRRLGLDNYLIL